MKKLIPLFLMLCCLVSVTACSKDEIVSNYNQALQSIGDKGLTDDKDLQGKREFGIDSYVGNYTADYDDFPVMKSFSGEQLLNEIMEIK